MRLEGVEFKRTNQKFTFSESRIDNKKCFVCPWPIGQFKK